MADITINNSSWTNINTSSGISSGTDVRVQNKGNYVVLLQVTDVEPDLDSTDGALITSANKPTPYADFKSVEEAIYAKVFYTGDNRSCNLYISEI